MGAWHASAKLRIQTESTLEFLKQQTRQLGAALRLFAGKVCGAYETRELPSEAAARLRRGANAAKKGKETTQNRGKNLKTAKSFNLNTYKVYAMGHYVNDIRSFGTTDNYSTLIVRSYFLSPIFLRVNHICTRESSNTSRQRNCMAGQISARVMYHRQLYIIDVNNCSDGSIPGLKLQPKRSRVRHHQTRGISSARQVHVYQLMIATHCLLCAPRNIIGSQARIRSMKM